jgi:hypothetical protein
MSNDTTSNEAEDFFAGGARSFQFENIGDMVSGQILEMVKRQQTSLTDGTKLFWDDGTPRMLLVITLATQDRNSDDDNGERTIYVRGGRYEVAKGSGSSMKDAIADALRHEGLRAPRIGDQLAVTYTGEGKGKRGYAPPKLYTAGYEKSAPRAAADFFDPDPQPADAEI